MLQVYESNPKMNPTSKIEIENQLKNAKNNIIYLTKEVEYYEHLRINKGIKFINF